MKHCNFRFDENKGEWMPKTDRPLAEKADKNDKITEEADPIPETVECNGLFETKL